MTLGKSRSRAAAAALVAVLGLAGTASAQTTRSVLDRYAAWRGGAGFRKLEAVSETGVFADGGLHGSGARYATSDGRLWSRSRFGPFSTVLQVTGAGGDYTDLAGQRLPLSPLEIGYARADAALLLPLPTGTSAALKPRETIGNQAAEVVEFDRGDAGRYDYLIEAQTGALLAVRMRRNGSTSMQTYADWRMVDGVRLPFHVHEEGHAGLGALQSDTTDFFVAHATLDPRADGATLAPLPNRRVVSFARHASSSGWMPFHLTDGSIFLDIVVDGHRVRALLDSGASQTALDQGFAGAHGITAVGRFLVGGQGGTTSTTYAPEVSIRAGAARLDGVVANVIDLQQPGTRMSPPLLVVLGAEVFAEAVVDIDYARSRLRFLAPAAAPRLPHGVTLPLGLFEGSFHFPISIEGRPPIPVLLDTGDQGALQIFPAYWRPRDMLATRTFMEGGNGGVGGEARFKLGVVSSIGLGSIELSDVPTAFQMPGNPVSNETGILGNCGDETLARFHVLVNFPARTITFERRHEGPGRR